MVDKSVEVVPFFERLGGQPEDWPGSNYIAGFRNADGTPSGVQVVVPAEMVEHAVLVNSRLSLAMNPDGTLALHSEGLNQDAVEAASQCCIGRQSLESLLKDCLRPELVAMEEDVSQNLRLLRTQLATGLALVDRALEELTRNG